MTRGNYFAVALVVVLLLAIGVWMALLRDPQPTTRKPVPETKQPAESFPETAVGTMSAERSAALDSGNRSESGGQPAATESRAKTEELIQRARAAGLGTLTDAELANLVDLLVVMEKNAASYRHDYVSNGGRVDSVEFADLTFDLEGAAAKARALLEGSYVLLPAGDEPIAEVAGDPNLHVVVGPGGVRDATPFQTHILIDLKRHGLFARALEDLVRLRKEGK